MKCFQRQLFGFGSRGGDQSLRVRRQRAEAERGMDPGLSSRLAGPPLPPPPAPHGLRPRTGDCVRARACAQAGEGEVRGAPGAGGWEGAAAWGHLVEPGAGSVCGARGSVRARLHAFVCVLVRAMGCGAGGVRSGRGRARITHGLCLHFLSLRVLGQY